MDILYLVAQQTMFFSIPLLIVALGGMFTERGGVTNIALDGVMIIGAFAGIFFINQMGQTMSGQLLLILAILISVSIGIVFSLLLAYSAINLKSDQIIGGTALNMLAPALAIYVARTIQENGVQQIQFINSFRIFSVPVLGDIPVIGNLFFKNAYLTTYIGLAILVISVVILYKTKFGLRLRACGEHPHAADSVGINVYKMRYAGVMISGGLAGLGGLVFIIPTSTNFNATVSGYGFLALAVMIFGQWRPIKILLAAFFFGLMKTVASAYSVIPILATSAIPGDVYKMIPFIATLIVLAFSSKSSQAPKAVAIPYDKGSR
ncbi:ABC transporter permease [Clostridium aminobutyricum]|uniref:ABC transporter permease n=1 Tax=Clostridium aminobutyricum TaxID=33953 RepID=A0A939IIS4_CLOAM|nr:ABC transporter permease [Clostridium aminobutyricum]MBN7772858.1 ABC transporter permease [Clostridium aminobutyricum]